MESQSNSPAGFTCLYLAAFQAVAITLKKGLNELRAGL
jgi:hypothetical protein